MTQVILDANVVFSGLGGQPAAFPVRTVRAVLTVDGDPLFNEELLTEYRRLLARPKAQARHRLTGSELLDFLDDLRIIGTVVSSSPGPPCPDAKDQHLWDLLATVPDAILITGEHQLLESHHFAGRVLSPRQFVERYLA